MKKGLLAVLALGLILFLAACGGSDSGDSGNEDDSSSASAASNELNITASNFDFDQDEYTVTAGEEVAVSLSNEEGMHGISIDEFDVKIEGEGEATFTPEEPGEYTIYCNIPCGEGHADMQTTLVVE